MALVRYDSTELLMSRMCLRSCEDTLVQLSLFLLAFSTLGTCPAAPKTRWSGVIRSLLEQYVTIGVKLGITVICTYCTKQRAKNVSAQTTYLGRHEHLLKEDIIKLLQEQ